jgi:hypothetical protein
VLDSDFHTRVVRLFQHSKHTSPDRRDVAKSPDACARNGRPAMLEPLVGQSELVSNAVAWPTGLHHGYAIPTH